MRSVLVVAVVMAGSLLYGQNPPIKMGLWEKTMVTKGGPGADATLKSKSCITAESWAKGMAALNKQREGCTQNVQKTAKGYSYDVSCTGAHINLVSHGTTTIQDAEHIVSDSHTTSTPASGQKREMEMHSTSHFLSSDCGKITPDNPEIEE